MSVRTKSGAVILAVVGLTACNSSDVDLPSRTVPPSPLGATVGVPLHQGDVSAGSLGTIDHAQDDGTSIKIVTRDLVWSLHRRPREQRPTLPGIERPYPEGVSH